MKLKLHLVDRFADHVIELQLDDRGEPSGIIAAAIPPEPVQTAGGTLDYRPSYETAATLAAAPIMRAALERLADGEWPERMTAAEVIFQTREHARQALKEMRDTIREYTAEEM